MGSTDPRPDPAPPESLTYLLTKLAERVGPDKGLPPLGLLQFAEQVCSAAGYTPTTQEVDDAHRDLALLYGVAAPTPHQLATILQHAANGELPFALVQRETGGMHGEVAEAAKAMLKNLPADLSRPLVVGLNEVIYAAVEAGVAHGVRKAMGGASPQDASRLATEQQVTWKSLETLAHKLGRRDKLDLAEFFEAQTAGLAKQTLRVLLRALGRGEAAEVLAMSESFAIPAQVHDAATELAAFLQWNQADADALRMARTAFAPDVPTAAELPGRIEGLIRERDAARALVKQADARWRTEAERADKAEAKLTAIVQIDPELKIKDELELVRWMSMQTHRWEAICSTLGICATKDPPGDIAGFVDTRGGGQIFQDQLRAELASLVSSSQARKTPDLDDVLKFLWRKAALANGELAKFVQTHGEEVPAEMLPFANLSISDIGHAAWLCGYQRGDNPMEVFKQAATRAGEWQEIEAVLATRRERLDAADGGKRTLLDTVKGLPGIDAKDFATMKAARDNAVAELANKQSLLDKLNKTVAKLQGELEDAKAQILPRAATATRDRVESLEHAMNCLGWDGESDPIAWAHAQREKHAEPTLARMVQLEADLERMTSEVWRLNEARNAAVVRAEQAEGHVHLLGEARGQDSHVALTIARACLPEGDIGVSELAGRSFYFHAVERTYGPKYARPEQVVQATWRAALQGAVAAMSATPIHAAGSEIGNDAHMHHTTAIITPRPDILAEISPDARPPMAAPQEADQIREAVEWCTVNAGRGLAAELAQDAAHRLLAKVQEGGVSRPNLLRWTIAQALHIGAETAVAWADGERSRLVSAHRRRQNGGVLDEVRGARVQIPISVIADMFPGGRNVVCIDPHAIVDGEHERVQLVNADCGPDSHAQEQAWAVCSVLPDGDINVLKNRDGKTGIINFQSLVWGDVQPPVDKVAEPFDVRTTLERIAADPAVDPPTRVRACEALRGFGPPKHSRDLEWLRVLYGRIIDPPKLHSNLSDIRLVLASSEPTVAMDLYQRTKQRAEEAEALLGTPRGSLSFGHKGATFTVYGSQAAITALGDAFSHTKPATPG